MAESQKNLCAHIPIELHNKVRAKQQESGKTLNEYVAELIREFYELKEREGESNMGDTRTLAVQIPAPLFDRLDEYLAKHRLKKKEFIIGLLREALDKVEAEEDNEETGES